MKASPAVAERITELMLGGYSIDFACEKGVSGGWTRANVLEVIHAKGWQLDASGRIPFRDRPRRPRATVQPQRRRTDRSIPAVAPELLDELADQLLQEASAELRGGEMLNQYAAPADTETPTTGAAPDPSGPGAVGTAPDSSGSGHGYAGSDAQPQVSPSRTLLGEDGGPGASDAPAGPPSADVEAQEDRPLADWELELLAPNVSPDDWVWDETAKCYELRSEQTTPEPASDQVEKFRNARPGDVLAVGLAHPHPAVRAKAKRVQRAVDELCTALSRSGRPC